MKTNCFIALFFSVVAFSCTQQTTEPLESYSPDHQLKIVVTAERTSMLDAWTTEIELTHEGNIDKVVQEFYADRVDDSTIAFDWKSNTTCIIHMKQRDGVLIDVPVSVHL